jgi:glycosyltransferase involved in cell wall biosynthesis
MASLKEYVRPLGYVSDEELALLYNLATLFVYPSWYEGFGLPALEAMACGCPVLTSNQSALPEVCAEAARYVHPGDVDGMRLALEELLNDPVARDSLARRGLRQAQRFSWDKSAQEHLSLFLEVCGQGPGNDNE